jgi:hypothetical protein
MGAASRQPFGTGSAVDFDPAAFAPGSIVELRVEDLRPHQQAGQLHRQRGHLRARHDGSDLPAAPDLARGGQ